MDVIRNFMEESILSIGDDKSISEAAKFMRNKAVSSLMVMVNGNYSGILTEVDIVRKVVAAGNDPALSIVRDIQTKDIITIESNLPMTDAYECMRNNNIRHLVVEDNGKIVGLLSIKDFANYYHNTYSSKNDDQGEIRFFMKDTFYSIDPGSTVFDASTKMAKLYVVK